MPPDKPRPRCASRIERTEEDVVEIVLDPDDRFAYARALGELTSMPDSMIVDPYFRFEQLVDVLELGTVTRVLTSRKIGPAALARLALGLKAVTEGQPFEVRLTAELHDRYFIPRAGCDPRPRDEPRWGRSQRQHPYDCGRRGEHPAAWAARAEVVGRRAGAPSCREAPRQEGHSEEGSRSEELEHVRQIGDPALILAGPRSSAGRPCHEVDFRASLSVANGR